MDAGDGGGVYIEEVLGVWFKMTTPQTQSPLGPKSEQDLGLRS